MTELARSWVNTDTDASRSDVLRLGLEGAAAYAASMAVGQEHWEALASPEGLDALRSALADLTQGS